jgi:hypothetical protein
MEAMFGSSLPPVVCEGLVSYLRYLFACDDVQHVMMSNTYCAVFLICFSSSCVLYVASFSGLSICDCPFGIL